MESNPSNALEVFNREAQEKKKFFKQEELLTPELIQKVMLSMDMISRCIDFRGLKKYLISSYFFETFIFKLVNEDKKTGWLFNINVGKGDRIVGSRLKPCVLSLCKDFGIEAFEEGEDRIPIKISKETAKRIKLIEEMKNTIDRLKQFKGADQSEKRLVMGFARGGCPALVTEHWKPNMTDKDQAELQGRVWPTIVNLLSDKFIQAIQKSDDGPQILEQFQKLSKEKPKTWNEVLTYCQKNEKHMCVIHTFSVYLELDLGTNFTPAKSPSITAVRELLASENKHLVLVFDEIIDEKEDDPLTKKLRAVQEEVKNHLKDNAHCFIILCLQSKSCDNADYMPYNKEWVEFMVDDLRKEEE